MTHKSIYTTLSIIGCTSALIISGWHLGATEAIAQNTPSPTPPPAALTTPSVEQILIGEWQLRDILPLGVKAVFTEDKKLYVFLPTSFPFFDGFLKQPIALDFRYRIDTTTSPYQIDITSASGGEPLLTIFELPTTKEMRVEFVGLNAGDTRPTSFTVGSVILEKLSTITALPRNVQLYDVQAEKLKQSQSQARSTMFNLNSSQAYFYSTRKKFATSLSELGAYVSPNDNYNYQISAHPSQKPGAIATAEAKVANFKSYTAAVVAFKSKGKTNTFSGVCETETPSKTAPAAPKIDAKGKVTCAPGSVPAK